MMDLRSLLDYKALHRDIKVGNMKGVSRNCRNIALFAAATALLMSSCTTREQMAAASEEPAYDIPPPMAEAAAVSSPPPPPPAPKSKATGITKNLNAARKSSSGARIGAVRGSSKSNANLGAVSNRFNAAIGKTRGLAIASKPGIPSYPVWPPEAPSSRVSLDRFIKARSNLTLYDAGQKLKRSFEDAGYLEYSYYAAPGGFVLVTRIEKISAKGDPLPGTERYKLPNQRSSGSLTSFVRGLFLDAPPGFYRYIAVVVSDQPYRTSRRKLSSTEAGRRLTRGSNNLSAAYKKVAFTRDHNVEALIYEFTKNTRTGKVRMIAPGRLTPKIHLAKTKLNKTILSNFRR